MSKVPNTQENEVKCVCLKCPTWLSNGCPKEKNELLYCAKGETVCELTEYGCLCGACPVYEEYNLDGGYFCLRSAAE